MEVFFLQTCASHANCPPRIRDGSSQTRRQAVLRDHADFLRQCRYVFPDSSIQLLTECEAPHVGHLYTMVLADILKRWRVLLGEDDAQLLTGTDEHGMKVRTSAGARQV